MEILDYTQNVSDSPYTVSDGFCCRLRSIHTWFIELQVAQAATDFEIVPLEFGDANPHFSKHVFNE